MKFGIQVYINGKYTLIYSELLLRENKVEMKKPERLSEETM